MATSQDTILDRLIINDVDSEDTLQDMADNDELEPNQLYMTPDETDGFIALPIGAIFPSSIPQTSSAFHLLDGSSIAADGIYSQFTSLLQNLVSSGYSVPVSTIDQYAIDLDTYGQSGRFIINTTNSSISSNSISYKSSVIRYDGYRLNSSGGTTSQSGQSVIFIPARLGQTFTITRATAPSYEYIYETTNYGTSFSSLGYIQPTFANTQTYTVTNANCKYIAITIQNADVNTYDIKNGNNVLTISANSVKLPKITKFIEGLSSITDIGTSFQAGLPNITGSMKMSWNDSSGGGIILGQEGSGAFYKTTTGTSYYRNSASTGSQSNTLNMDASRSSSIYGRSSTVQPQSTAYPYYIVLANSYKTDIQVDIDQVASDLELKADKDAGNLSSADVESWANKTKFERTDVFYDMSSSDSSINWGYTSGIPCDDTRRDGHNFSKYNRIICFISNETSVNNYTSYITVVVDLTHQAEPTGHNRYYCGENSAVTNYVVYDSPSTFELKGAFVGINQAKTGITIYGFTKGTGSASKLSGLYCTKIIGVY